jgi:hypothetical protein
MKSNNNKIKIIEDVIINEPIEEEFSNIIMVEEHKCFWFNQKGEP